MKTGCINICFKTKGNHRQGMGDVMGSLALADELGKRGNTVTFIIDDDDEAKVLVKKAGYEFVAVKKGSSLKARPERHFDIMIVNQLTSPGEELSRIRGYCTRMVTIDDTGDASMKLADLRINPLYYTKKAYADFKYIPLHAVFQKAHQDKKIIRNKIGRILVTMGGSDTYGFTPQILKAIESCPEDIRIAVILGPAFKDNGPLNRVLERSKRGFDLIRAPDINGMCRWIKWADLAICGAGNTLFEIACCGTPAIVICNEPFEEETAYRLEKKGFGVVIPFNKRLDADRLKRVLTVMQGKTICKSQSATGKRLIDGMGINRIAGLILGSRGG